MNKTQETSVMVVRPTSRLSPAARFHHSYLILHPFLRRRPILQNHDNCRGARWQNPDDK